MERAAEVERGDGPPTGAPGAATARIGPTPPQRADLAAAAALALRIALGVVILPHGAGKLLGWFGGRGLEGTIVAFREGLGMPAVVALLVVAAEFCGSLGLLAGLLTRLAASGIAAVMVGAIALRHAEHGFFMNWKGTQGGEGFEYHLLAIGLCAGLVLGGGGAWSIDAWLARRRHAGAAEPR